MEEKRSDRDIYKCIEDLSSGRKDAGMIVKKIKAILKTTGDLKYVVNVAKNNELRGVTWLHAAISSFSFESSEEKQVVKLLVKKYPKLILQARGETDTEYTGQTPLHMGVCKGNIWSVDWMLNKLIEMDKSHWKVALLKRRATGRIFEKTAMMAELPLLIAALTFNKDMFDLLLDHGAELDAVNSRGDNVCHALIRHAYYYPDKIEDVLDMCRYIRDISEPDDRKKITGKQLPKYKEPIYRKLCRKIWLMKNNEGLNPLRLATQFGQHEIFRLIMDLESYCSENTRDGLFDIKVYDITEIDAISSMSTGINKTQSTAIENISKKKTGQDVTDNPRSIMMMLLDLDPRCAFHFIMFPAVRRVIDKKWNQYRIYFYPFWVIHLVFMCFLTKHAVEKSEQINNSATGESTQSLTYEHSSPEFVNKIPSDAFVTAYGIITLVVGILYIAQDVLRVFKRRMPYTRSSFENPYNNGTFRLMFVLFGLLLILDFGLSWAPKYENYLLVIAILLGWFLIIFFLRGLRSFSFITVLIQRVLIEDMSRFFVILAIELIAFSTAMYMVVQGSDLTSDQNFSSFGRIIFAMGKLMLGLGEIDIYAVRHPVFAIVIFVAFIILTTLLMINALIAMMSRTCSDLVDDVAGINIRDMHWKLQTLSLILFIESILPCCCISRCGDKYDGVRWYNNEVQRRTEVTRYRLDIKSLQNETKKQSETSDTRWDLGTTFLKAMRSFPYGKEQSDKSQSVYDVPPVSTRSKIRDKEQSDKKQPASYVPPVSTRSEVHDKEQSASDVPPVSTRSEMTPVNEVRGPPSHIRHVLDVYDVTNGESK